LGGVIRSVWWWGGQIGGREGVGVGCDLRVGPGEVQVVDDSPGSKRMSLLAPTRLRPQPPALEDSRKTNSDAGGASGLDVEGCGRVSEIEEWHTEAEPLLCLPHAPPHTQTPHTHTPNAHPWAR
jgi:hypothetical protein